MKAGLSRLEKVSMLKTLAAECDEKQRKRIPINPRPRPASADAAARERARRLLSTADEILHQALIDEGRVPEADWRSQCRQALEHYNASIAANAVPIAIAKRASAYNVLDMFEESVNDVAWAEQLIRESPGPLDTDMLLNALCISALSKAKLGRYEDSQDDLQILETINADDLGVRELVNMVRSCMEGYNARSGGDFCRERAERIEDFDGFGLSLYELALLEEAGLNPWVGYAKHILQIVNSVEKDVQPTKSRAHYAAKQCNNCRTDRFSSKIFLCTRCKAAWYCSKECQKMAWKDHKASCKRAGQKRDDLNSLTVAPAPNCDVPDQPTSGAELVDTMSAWCDKHKPAMVQALCAALDIRANPDAHLTKGLKVTIEWVSGAKSTARRFRMVQAALSDLSSFHDEKTIQAARRSAQDSRKDGAPVAMIIVMCVSCVPSKGVTIWVALTGGTSHIVDRPSGKWFDALAAQIG